MKARYCSQLQVRRACACACACVCVCVCVFVFECVCVCASCVLRIRRRKYLYISPSLSILHSSATYTHSQPQPQPGCPGARLGKVHEVFGPIAQPFYTLRAVASPAAAATGTAGTGAAAAAFDVEGEYVPGVTTVFCLPSHSSTAYVNADMLKAIRLAR